MKVVKLVVRGRRVHLTFPDKKIAREMADVLLAELPDKHIEGYQ